eukprot:3455111-Rhodomonas_salina.2
MRVGSVGALRREGRLGERLRFRGLLDRVERLGFNGGAEPGLRAHILAQVVLVAAESGASCVSLSTAR